MLNKIDKAREIIKKYNEIYNIDFILKLEETADEFEFVYNNLELSQNRSNALENKLKKLEQELDELLKKAENIKLNIEKIER